MSWMVRVCFGVAYAMFAADCALAAAPGPAADYPAGLSIGANNLIHLAPDQFPADLRENLDEQPWRMGFLDVARAPFGAAGDGVTDDTQAIQRAIDEAYRFRFGVFFPSGTYLVSQTLLCRKQNTSQRNFGHSLIGDARGGRAVIRLKDGSRLTDNVVLLFQFIDEAGKPSPMSNYSALLRDVDFDMGDNPTADAVSMPGAQLCAIEDVTIRGRAFHAGVHQMPGSGGSIVNLRVIGGRIGILQDEFRPNPSVTGLVLEGQSECGIKVSTARGPVVVTGFRIVSPESPPPDYRAVILTSTSVWSGYPATGNLSMTDGTIEVRGAGGTAIENYAKDVVLKDVYVKAATIIRSGIASPPAVALPGDALRWTHVPLYAFTSAPDKGTVFVDGQDLSDHESNCQYVTGVAQEAPTADFTRIHSWSDMPSWQDAGTVDVVADYGATPGDANNEDDDTAAIQKAIDETTTAGNPNSGKAVFVPRGRYVISRQLVLKDGTKLIGAGQHTSIIQMSPTWEDAAQPALETVDGADARVLISDVGILGWPCCRLLWVRSGRTLIRNLQTETIKWQDARSRLGAPRFPYVMVSDGGGGRFYNISLDHVALTDVPPRGDVQFGPDYSLLLVDGTRSPVAFYQLSIEHLKHSPQMMIRGSRDVAVYGLKFENREELLRITDSSNVSVYGGSGNYGIYSPEVPGIIAVEDSTGIVFSNLDRLPQKGEVKSSWISDDGTRIPDTWPLVLYQSRSGAQRVR
jgi:hypothetical protein